MATAEHRRELNRSWRNNNRDQRRALDRRYYKNNPDKVRDRQLRIKFGITLVQYNELLVAQGGCCALCGSPDPKTKGKNFAVDHDHSTGKNRGLLCGNCNKGLGFFNDSEELLSKARSYLEKYREHGNG